MRKTLVENFGLKIALQGEQEFKRANIKYNVSSMCSGLSRCDYRASPVACSFFRVLWYEMKLVAAQLKRSDVTQAKYAAKGKVLAEQISTQKDKINTRKQALKNTATNFEETDRKTLAWQTQFNNAKAALADLEGELEDNNKALESFGGNADMLRMTLDKRVWRCNSKHLQAY